MTLSKPLSGTRSWRTVFFENPSDLAHTLGDCHPSGRPDFTELTPRLREGRSFLETAVPREGNLYPDFTEVAKKKPRWSGWQHRHPQVPAINAPDDIVAN
jgi:hypothetical protein